MARTRRDFLRSGLAAALAASAGGVLLGACGDDDAEGAAATTAGPAPSTSAGATTAPSTTTGELRAMSAMMPFPLFLAFIAEVSAVSGGFMAAHGIDLDLRFARSAPQALQQLAAGNVTVIRNSPIGLVRAVSREGAPFVSIATANQEVLYRLVSTDSAPVDSLEQVVGGTVGMATLGGNAEDTLILVLRSAGLDPEEVDRVAVGNEAAALTFVEDGRVDALFATIESTASMRALGLTPHVAPLEGANPLLGTAVVTSRDTLESDRDLLVHFLRGLHDAMIAISEPEGLQALVSEIRADWDLAQLDDFESAAPVVEAISSLWYAAGEENLLRNVPERWAEGVAGFEQLGIAAEGSDPTEFYTNEIVDEALG